MKLRHKLISRLIDLMGHIYVWLDAKMPPVTGAILGLEIDDDFESMTRRELCNHIEKKFGLEKDEFWFLQSTQKIRFCCQKARELMAPNKMEQGY
jgi:environmental stress-induced protein Ves